MESWAHIGLYAIFIIMGDGGAKNASSYTSEKAWTCTGITLTAQRGGLASVEIPRYSAAHAAEQK
eukprot:1195565-Prorocentrum_minimum.AAC.1